ncbi:MAG: protein kinase [Myxococcota bacterium]
MNDPTRLEEVFMAALDRPTAERRAYVAHECADDDGLLAEVQALLEADAAADGFLESPLRNLALDEATLAGRTIGPYEVISEIGRGGMGVVYEARQERPARTVALKVLRVGLGGPAAIDRFLHEIEILGRLRHPGIAQIYAADVHEGVPYYAMELILGATPITKYVHTHDLPMADRLLLLAAACDAVQHGHDRGVIHRDIKPSNIVVDRDGAPKLIDFGVARASDPGGDEAYTATGHIVGTVRYMSPEQRTVDGDVDVRSDVYALGVVLYEVLVGRYPFDVRGATPLALVKELEHAAVVPPSSVGAQFRGDPETILLRALAPEASRRYPSARALAEDLRRLVRGDAIEARRDEPSYLLRKALSRYKVPLAATAVAAVVIIGGSFAWMRALAAERTAAAIDRAEAAESRAAQADALRRSTYTLRIALAGHAYAEQNLGRMRELLGQCDADLRGWEWTRLSWLSDRSTARVSAHAGTIEAVAFDQTGERFASAGADGAVILWRMRADGTPERVRSVAVGLGHLHALAWTADGLGLVVGGRDPTLVVLDVQSGEVRSRLEGHAGFVRAVAVSSDGVHIASASDDDTFRVWDTERGVSLATLRTEDQALAVDFAPDGDLVTGGADERLRRWDLETSSMRWEVHPVGDAIETLAIAPDGKTVAVAGWDPEISVIDLEDGTTRARLAGHPDGVREVRFTPDGERIVSAGWDDVVRVWDVAERAQLLELRGHGSNVEALAVHRDGRRVVSGGADHQLRVWDLQRGPDHRVLSGHGEKIHAMAFSSDAAQLVTGSGPHFDAPPADASVRVWDVASGRERQRFDGHAAAVTAIAIDGKDRRVASGDRDGVIHVWALGGPDSSRAIQAHEGRVVGLVWHADGVLSAGVDGALRRWNPESGERRAELRLDSPPSAIAQLADGSVAVGDTAGHLNVWDAGEHIRAVGRFVPGEIQGLAAVAGSHVVVAAKDGTLALADTRTGIAVWSVETFDGALASVAVDPTGERIVVGDTEFNVRLFDVAQGAELMLVGRHDSFVSSVAFSPDGRRLASAGFDQVVRLWETEDTD